MEGRKLWDEDPSRIPFQKSKNRAGVLITVILFCFLAICVRLIDLMIIDHEWLAKEAEQQYIQSMTLKSQRGIIWDRKMREMVTNIDRDSVYAIPSHVLNTKYFASKFAPVLRIPQWRLQRKLQETREKKREFIWLARKVDMSTARKVRELEEVVGKEQLDFITESLRYYPKGQTASHVLGFTDIDDKGIAGLELMYDRYLEGKVRRVSLGTDARGENLSRGKTEAIAGNNIILTIDEGLQHIVERELTQAMKEWKAKAAVAIMMNPMTGEILAMSNRPTFDPNRPGKASDEARRNRAVTDFYEPGSTLKAILAAAALEEGRARPNELFDVSKGFIVVGGKAIRDIHRNKILTFREVIQRSSNVGAVQIGLQLGKDLYDEYLRKFGFGSKTGIDFPGEIGGLLRKKKEWSGTSLAALSIGQEIGTTPLQILRAYAAIANGGRLVRPYLISEIISPEGKVVRVNSSTVERRVISENTAHQVKEILKTVVEEGGTARRASISGNPVAGKTGTAQVFDSKAKRYSKNRFISSFVGFVPADRPGLALIVVVFEPRGETYGGLVAAPVFKRIIEHSLTYLNVPMEKDGNRIVLVRK